MSEEIEYGAVDRFQSGAIGEPGNRTFYVYIETGGVPRWFTCEKLQVAALAEQSLEVLTRMEVEIDEGLVELTVSGIADIPWPSTSDDVVFRIGSMSMRLAEGELLTLVLEDTDGEQTVSFSVTHEQLRAMSLLALDAVHSGRPICPKCHLPEDPDGHDCPSSNGHRPIEA